MRCIYDSFSTFINTQNLRKRSPGQIKEIGIGNRKNSGLTTVVNLLGFIYHEIEI